MAENQGATLHRRMAARAIGFSLVAKLPGMRIGMAIRTLFSDSFISFLMTTKARNGGMLPDQRK
jgi:hypothetical protein